MKHCITYKTLFLSVVSLVIFSLSSCEKEQKKYEGEAQLAFGNSSYKMSVTAQTNSITIPIQLIANSSIQAIGTVKTAPTSTCADAINYTPQFTIDPATFSYKLVIALNYTALKTGNNTLILQLESDLPIAKYYGTTTITIVK